VIASAVNVTEADTLRQELSPAQEQAVGLVLAGRCDREVAEAVGVARGTVWRWRHEDPVFIAALNRERQALAEAMTERLRSIRDKALGVVEEALDAGDVGAALAITRVLAASLPPIRALGATTAAGVERQWEAARRDAERAAELDELLSNL
jgi:hypothetical protein